MPRKALGARAVRPSARDGNGRTPKIGALSYICGDGTQSYGGQPCVATAEDGRRWWPFYRVRIWASMLVGQLPRASREFDLLTTDGADALADWHLEDFAVAAVVAGLESDRAAVAAFRKRDRSGARDIAVYLAAFLEDFASIEAEARRVAAWSGPFYTRSRPQVGRGRRYGTLPAAHRRGRSNGSRRPARWWTRTRR